MNISGPFIRRPIGTSLLAIGLFVVGMICYSLLGVAALPNIEFPAIFVQAQQPGADASTMASTVAAPLERHLGQVPGVDRDALEQFRGQHHRAACSSTWTATSTPPRATCSRRSMRRSRICPPTCRRADVPEGQPRRRSDRDPGADLRHAGADRALRRRRLDPRAASAPAVKASTQVDIAGGATPAVRVEVNLRALERHGPVARPRAQRAHGCQRRPRRRASSTDGHTQHGRDRATIRCIRPTSSASW